MYEDVDLNNEDTKEDDDAVLSGIQVLITMLVTSSITILIAFFVILCLFHNDISKWVESYNQYRVSTTEGYFENSLNISNIDQTILGHRADVMFLKKGSPNMEDYSYSLKYCIGDIVEIPTSLFQVLACEKVKETGSSDVYEVTMRLCNKDLHTGVWFYGTTGVYESNAPLIKISTTKAKGREKYLTLDDTVFNLVLSQGNSVEFKGLVHIGKGDTPEVLEFRLGEDLSDKVVLSLDYKVKELKSIPIEFTPFTPVGILKVYKNELININGMQLKVTGSYLRAEDSKYTRKTRGENNKELVVYMDIENNTGVEKNLAELYNFALLSDNGKIYRETIDNDVVNQVNNKNAIKELKLNEGVKDYVANFEVPDGNYTLLIKDKNLAYGKNKNTLRDYLVAVSLN